MTCRTVSCVPAPCRAPRRAVPRRVALPALGPSSQPSWQRRPVWPGRLPPPLPPPPPLKSQEVDRAPPRQCVSARTAHLPGDGRVQGCGGVATLSWPPAVAALASILVPAGEQWQLPATVWAGPQPTPSRGARRPRRAVCPRPPHFTSRGSGVQALEEGSLSEASHRKQIHLCAHLQKESSDNNAPTIVHHPSSSDLLLATTQHQGAPGLSTPPWPLSPPLQLAPTRNHHLVESHPTRQPPVPVWTALAITAVTAATAGSPRRHRQGTRRSPSQQMRRRQLPSCLLAAASRRSAPPGPVGPVSVNQAGERRRPPPPVELKTACAADLAGRPPPPSPRASLQPFRPRAPRAPPPRAPRPCPSS